MAELARAVPGVRVILDTSHAQLYLNVRRGVQEEVPGQDLGPLRQFVAEAPVTIKERYVHPDRVQDFPVILPASD